MCHDLTYTGSVQKGEKKWVKKGGFRFQVLFLYNNTQVA